MDDFYECMTKFISPGLLPLHNDMCDIDINQTTLASFSF